LGPWYSELSSVDKVIQPPCEFTDGASKTFWSAIFIALAYNVIVYTTADCELHQSGLWIQVSAFHWSMYCTRVFNRYTSRGSHVFRPTCFVDFSKELTMLLYPVASLI